ncbi:MAG: DUF4132 domain-containing protein [Pseudomonadota bacterium]|nr:DUF4132 domain-containing protein [Pseudomonadota bacterium]
MQRFELIEGKSAKFWEVQCDGDSLTVRYGRIGTQGQTQTKTLADATAALKERDKLIREKTGKGYSEVDADAQAAPTAVAPKATPPKTTAPAAPTVAQAAPPAQVVAAPARAPEPPPAPGRIDPAALDWPQGGLDEKARKALRLPVVRGVHCPPLPKVLGTLAYPPVLYASPGGHEARNLQTLGQPLGHQWTYWGGDSPLHLTRERLAKPDIAFWQEATAQCVGDPAAHQWLMQIGSALHGVAFILEVVLPMQAGAPDARLLPYALKNLRHTIAAAAEPAYRAAFAVAERLRESAPALHEATAYLFPHHQAWVDDALALPPQSDRWLADCVMTVDQLRGYLQGAQWLHDLDDALALQLHLHGTQAMPLLHDLIQRLHNRNYVVDALLHHVGTLRCPEQIPVLMRHMAQHKPARAALDHVAEQHPAAALYTAIAHLHAHPGEPLQGWALRLATRHPDALRQALAVLAGDEAAAARAFADKLGALEALAASEALPGELPELLRHPPWLRELRAQPLPTLDVPQLPHTPRIDWPDEELAQLRAMPANSWARQHVRQSAGKGPKGLEIALLSYLGIRHEAIDAILAGRPITGKDLRPSANGSKHDPDLLRLLPPDFALQLWNHYPAKQWWHNVDSVRALLALHGVAALPGFAAYCHTYPALGLPAALRVDDQGVASAALHALRNATKAKDAAQRWLRAWPRTAASVALREAFSADKAGRDNGTFALRWLMREGHEALLAEVAAAYGPRMSAALAALQSADPLHVLPARMPALPAFFAPATLARPLLADGRALPLSAVQHIASMLAISKLDAPYVGIDTVRALCTPDSLDAFAWDLFEAWLDADAPAKEGWAFAALGLLGTDATVRRLTPKIREWPGESAHARAVTGLDVLTAIGTDLALMNLSAIANKLKFKGLQEKAREKIAAIAEARDLTPDELADRLVPDLGLDEGSALALDFGPRQFSVAFDETLKPFVRDAQGARLKDLPKPIKSDDADQASAATDRYKQLKKDAKAIASMQVTRLELAMTSQRRWSSNDFKLFFLHHPVMRFLAARLVWGVYSDGAFVEAFRVAEDFTLADRNDDAYTLADDASVGIAHVLEMPADTQAAFGQILADYEILQPFRQLGRETYTLTPDELQARKITRFAAKTVATGSVMGLVNRGWERGEAQDAGWVGWFSKRLSASLIAVADLDPGTVVGDMSYEPRQRITEITVHQASRNTWDFGDPMPLESINAVTASELLRDIDLLAPYKEEA